MNVQCSHCNTVFRVDPAKVPAGGLRARCSICRGIFPVSAPEGAPAEAAEAAAPSTVAAVPIPAHDPVPPPVPERQPEPAEAPAPAPAAAVEAPPPPPAPSPAPAPRPAPTAGAPSPFNPGDPNAKMRRLARALVSDIAMYHPERRDRALESGTLKKEFMDEIKKSWEEYVAQVGAEKARSAPHFRDALNDILAKGQAIF